MYSRPVARLLWCAPSERKGCGSTLEQQELAMARACVCVRWCLVLVPSVAGLGTWQTWAGWQCSGRMIVQ